MAYPASLIAFAFVIKGVNRGQFVTQMKLQKLVYFAHGYHLVKYGKPLLNEQIEAWKYGPVVPEIYHDFKSYGSNPITDTRAFDPSFDVFKFSTLNEEAWDSVNYTWEVIGDSDAVALSQWTHEADSPWSKHYVANERSTVIPNDAIKSYFSKLLIKQNEPTQ